MKMESSVEVGVDPATAFQAFTEEMEHWWGNGPIDAWDFSRTVGRRIEPGVGGRVLEVYDDDALELARVTAWEPGRRLAWKSSVDDVAIEVRFDATGTGTLVRVEGEVPTDDARRAGLAVLRVTPQWFPRYFARGRRPWPALDRLMVIARYRRPAATAGWLCDAFGFVSTADVPGDEREDTPWIELRLGGSVVIVQGRTGARPEESTHEVFLLVDDLDAHFERAERAGATILQPIKTHGFTAYVAADPEGGRWSFVQANARTPARG